MEIDMSLDDIIKKKNIGSRRPVKKGFIVKNRASPIVRKQFNPAHRVVDARNKIVQKKRLQIRDAREKLLAKSYVSDARLKLQSRSNMIGHSKLKTSNRLNNHNYYHPSNHIDEIVKPKMPLTIGAPRGYVDYDNMESMEDEFNVESVELRRTVQNDVLPPGAYMTYVDDRSIPVYDHFESYDLKRSHNDDINLRRQIRNASPTPNIDMRSTNPSPPVPFGRERHYAADSSHLSYEMRSRLERAPDPHQSMGIFANPLKQPSSNQSNYRIIVSNLAAGVTQSDIAELFEDIGELDEARLVRTGVAEVIFKNLKDAEKAVDTYHNRQLDGQPMKCLLVNPNSSNKMSSSMGSSKKSKITPLEIDIDTLHKVLFRRN